MKRFPRIYIEISNQCNLACAFCPSVTKPGTRMTMEQFTHILDEVSPITDHVYFHVQGEPLMHPQLPEFLDQAHYRKLRVHLVTNGTLLERWGTKLLRHPALAQFTVSLHAWETLDDRTFERLRSLLREIILEADNNSCSLFLRIWNKKSERMARLLNDSFTEESLHQWRQPSKTRLKLSPKVTLDLDTEFRWPSLDDPFISTRGTCHAGSMMMAVLADGTLTPCCLDPQGLLSLGNLHEQPFSHLLEHPRYEAMMAGFKEKTCTEALCQHCSFRTRFD